MKTDGISTKRLGYHIELRIHGWGDTGKGDRTSLLSELEARLLAYRLLADAETLKASLGRAA
jgi:hypothetical protein